MSRRLDIGICAYREAGKLDQAIRFLRKHSVTDWRLMVIDNPAEGSETRSLIERWQQDDERIVACFNSENVGYAGAVNQILEWAETENIAYLDHDAYVQTRGWDERLCGFLDRFHEIGIIFPGEAPYPINRGAYTECMWGVGFCWIVSRLAYKDTGPMDTVLGHQEEADWAQRIRMAGYRCACVPDVQVSHDATASTNPASVERISRGVVNWVNKWNRYFNGKNFNYHSPNVTRFEDWPPNALYLEEYWRGKLNGLNAAPETREIDGRLYDLIRVPRLSGFYTGRII